MALGGGVFIGHNKGLPGAYVNFVSLARVGAGLSERGAVAFPLSLDWGVEEEIFVVNKEDFIKKSMVFFGYDYTHEKVREVREIFRNARVLYCYRLGKSDSVDGKAQGRFGVAKYSGVRGNDLRVTSEKFGSQYIVKTFIDGYMADSQTVSQMSGLKENDFVVWKYDNEISENSGDVFSGGCNPGFSPASYQKFLDQVQSEPVNAIGVCTGNPEINQMFAEFTKNMRDNIGVKLQCVLYNEHGDHEGIVNVKNAVDISQLNEAKGVQRCCGVFIGFQGNCI